MAWKDPRHQQQWHKLPIRATQWKDVIRFLIHVSKEAWSSVSLSWEVPYSPGSLSSPWVAVGSFGFIRHFFGVSSSGPLCWLKAEGGDLTLFSELLFLPFSCFSFSFLFFFCFSIFVFVELLAAWKEEDKFIHRVRQILRESCRIWSPPLVRFIYVPVWKNKVLKNFWWWQRRDGRPSWREERNMKKARWSEWDAVLGWHFHIAFVHVGVLFLVTFDFLTSLLLCACAWVCALYCTLLDVSLLFSEASNLSN